MKKLYSLANLYNNDNQISFKAKMLYRKLFKGDKNGLLIGFIDIDELTLDDALTALRFQDKSLAKYMKKTIRISEPSAIGKTFDNTLVELTKNLADRIHYTRYVRQDKTIKNFSQIALICDSKHQDEMNIRGLIYAESAYSKTAQMPMITDMQLATNDFYLSQVSSKTR